MKKIDQIKALILDVNVSDEEVKEEIEILDPDTSDITKEEGDEIVCFLKEKRPDLFNKWQLEIAIKYM